MIFSLIGIGMPVAMGVAVLKYRLYDLDLVVKKTIVFAILVLLLLALAGLVALLGGITGALAVRPSRLCFCCSEPRRAPGDPRCGSGEDDR